MDNDDDENTIISIGHVYDGEKCSRVQSVAIAGNDVHVFTVK